LLQIFQSQALVEEIPEICRRYGSELSLILITRKTIFTTYIANQWLKEDSTSRQSFWIGFQSIDNLSTNTLESASGRFIANMSLFGRQRTQCPEWRVRSLDTHRLVSRQTPQPTDLGDGACEDLYLYLPKTDLSFRFDH